MMLTAYLRSQLRVFSERYDYDTTYLAGMAHTDPKGFVKLAMAMGFTQHRFGLPAAVYFAAKVTATRHADCGSCLRLVIAMAEEAGVPRAGMRALLMREDDADPDMELAASYAAAVLNDRPELMEIIPRVEAQWGERGLAGLAAATVSGLFYPILKRGLGHGNQCEPVIAMLRAEAEGDTRAHAAA